MKGHLKKSKDLAKKEGIKEGSNDSSEDSNSSSSNSSQNENSPNKVRVSLVIQALNCEGSPKMALRSLSEHLID